MNQKVDDYISKNDKWIHELEILRSLMLETELEETFKWSYPVYTINNKNVLSLGAFKNHYCIWFFNGVFLKNTAEILIQAQESTKAMRQIRFEKDSTIDLSIVRDYVLEAIDNQKKGLEIKPTKSKTYEMGDILQAALNGDSELLSAFNALPFGKQKDYANYITSAKQEKTKLARLDKIVPMILAGVGLHDKYRKC